VLDAQGTKAWGETCALDMFVPVWYEHMHLVKGGARMNPPARRQNRPSSTAEVVLLLVPVVALLTASRPLVAHHGAAAFDTTRTVTVEGTVTEFVWANPHVYVKVDVTDESGQTVNWVVESQSVVNQANAGWSSSMFKPGDQVLLDATPAKGGRPVGIFRSRGGRLVINGKEFTPRAR
jgi:hypothetical protein